MLFFLGSDPVWVCDHLCGSFPPSPTVCSAEQCDRDSSGRLQVYHSVEETPSGTSPGYRSVCR